MPTWPNKEGVRSIFNRHHSYVYNYVVEAALPGAAAVDWLGDGAGWSDKARFATVPVVAGQSCMDGESAGGDCCPRTAGLSRIVNSPDIVGKSSRQASSGLGLTWT